jgi:F-type H+-transporting ATPase subunit a
MEHHPFTWLSWLPYPDQIETCIGISIALILFALFVGTRLRDTEKAIDPDDGMSARNLAEATVELISSMAENVIGHDGSKYVPLLAAFFVYILVCNLLGLIPGFSPPTAHFGVTFGLGVVAFLAYNYAGFREHGVAYGKHFLGPVIFLAPLMLLIELVSHSFRPMSLGIRLAANMSADHTVIEVFTDMTSLIVPVLFLGLGAFVSLIQAFVFTMLSAIYISLAVSHDH